MLLDFLIDTITNMDTFKEDIGTVYIFEEKPGHVVATGNHPKRLLFYRTEPVDNLSQEITAPAFLGALPYLRSMLTSTHMKEGAKVDLIYRDVSSKPCVEMMRFTSKERKFEAKFQCTNPNILSDKDRVRQFPRPADAIFFPITKAMRKEFDEIARMGTPKADMRLFTMIYDGNYVRAQVGAGTHTSTLVLSDEVTGATDNKIQKQVSLDRFRQMLKLSSDNDGAKCGFHSNAVWVDFTTKHSVHTIASPTIRDQVKV